MRELDEIQARVADSATYNFGMHNADKLAHEDAPLMLAAIRSAIAHIDDCDGTNYRVDGQYIKWIIGKTLRGEALSDNICPVLTDGPTLHIGMRAYIWVDVFGMWQDGIWDGNLWRVADNDTVESRFVSKWAIQTELVLRGVPGGAVGADGAIDEHMGAETILGAQAGVQR